MRNKWLWWVVWVIMLPVLFYSFFLTGWVASYLTMDENWKAYIVFTPESTSDSREVYEIDKLLYAFRFSPVLTSVFILSAAYVFITPLFFLGKLVRKKIRNI